MTRRHTLATMLTLPLAMCFNVPTAVEAVEPFPDIIGPELWIDGPDADQPGTQRIWPDVAVDNNGRRIHVWAASGGGLDNNDILLRLWDAEGNALGAPVVVNTTTVERQIRPRVAVSADGSFLVIYQSFEPIPIGVDRIVVRSQAFSSSGNPVGNEQLLSTTLPLEASDVHADVAALRGSGGSHGGYIVVWKSNEASGSDTNHSIEACLVSSTGTPGVQFQVNSETAGNQDHPSVTELSDGGFLVAWEESGDVWGRHFDSDGIPIGNDGQISTFSEADAFDTDAAIGWNGNIMVAWADRGDDAGTSSEIRARLFDADLMGLGPDFRVNTVTEDTQEDPRIADYGPIGFLVVWYSDVASGDDLGESIEARVVTGVNAFDPDEDGMDEPQVQYNVWDNNNNQQFPGAHGWYGRITADWRSLTWDGEPMPDNTEDDFIVGRDIEHCIFCSDFDWFDQSGSGNFWRWSNVQIP